MFSIHSFPSIPIPFFLSTTSITLTRIHFHSISLIPFHYSHSFAIHLLTPHSHLFSGILPSLFTVLIHFIHLTSHSSIFHPLHIPLISFLRFSSSFPNYEFYTMFVRIVVIACSFVLLIGNTLSQLDVIAFVSDSWFESSSIEWWGNGRMGTWGLEGIGVAEAAITEFDSIGW